MDNSAYGDAEVGTKESAQEVLFMAIGIERPNLILTRSYGWTMPPDMQSPEASSKEATSEHSITKFPGLAQTINAYWRNHSFYSSFYIEHG